MVAKSPHRQPKATYGLDHLNSSRYNVFLERPMFIDAFNDDTRRLGIVMHGKNKAKTMNWMLGGYSGDKVQDEDAFYKSEQFQGEIAGRFAHCLLRQRLKWSNLRAGPSWDLRFSRWSRGRGYPQHRTL